MRIGQPVEIESDVYGSDVNYKGKIASLGIGTGSAFSLLPAQNATGNWIKIVQRIPVRVVFDRSEAAGQAPAAAGHVVECQREPARPPTARSWRSRRRPSRPSARTSIKQQLANADDVIAQIIHANMAAPEISRPAHPRGAMRHRAPCVALSATQGNAMAASTANLPTDRIL